MSDDKLQALCQWAHRVLNTPVPSGTRSEEKLRAWDWALEMGVLEPVVMQEPCGDRCFCQIAKAAFPAVCGYRYAGVMGEVPLRDEDWIALAQVHSMRRSFRWWKRLTGATA